MALSTTTSNAIYNHLDYPWTNTDQKVVDYAHKNKEMVLRLGKIMYERYDSKYAGFIEEQLAKHKVPKEMYVLAAIESGFKENAVSHAGASGMWQFMAPTARDMGLKVNSRVDERNDWKKSTVAAIKYIKWLAEDKFGGDYETAIISYNYGIGNTYKLIAKEKTANATKLIRSGSIPKESEEYLMKFLVFMNYFEYLKDLKDKS